MAATSESLSDLASRLRLSGTTLLDDERESKAPFAPAMASSSVAAAVEAALAEPLNFPPVAEATISSDRVVLAVDEGVPALGQVVAGAIQTLKNTGVKPERVEVVVAEAATGKRIEQALSDAGFQDVKIVAHDSSDRDLLSFLGMTKAGKPLLLNRTIVDADLVIPIGCTRLEGVLGNAGIYDSVFPRFGEADILKQWRNLGHDPQEAYNTWRKQADEAGWMLGAPLVLEVVPGPNGQVQRILAGEANRVAKESLAAAEEVWSRTYAQPASLVVAGLDDFSWDNVARAVWAAEPVLAYDGALVLCCPGFLGTGPKAGPRLGKSVSRLLDFDDLDRVQRELAEDAEVDTWAAGQLAAALQRGPVYLMNAVDDDSEDRDSTNLDLVENLGLAPIESFDQLERLASRHETCIVLEDAHFVSATVNSAESGGDE